MGRIGGPGARMDGSALPSGNSGVGVAWPPPLPPQLLS